LRPKGDVIG